MVMKEKVRIFLDSDLLEKYLLGDTSPEESLQVERYIAIHPKVSEAYNELQKNLEHYAEMHSIKTPKELRSRILQKINQNKRKNQLFYRYSAACFALLLFAGSSYFFYHQNNELQKENASVNSKIRVLEINMKDQLEDLRNQYIVLNNPNTKKYSVKGNRKARDLKAVAYINPIKKLSYINVNHLPQLPEEQCFQMWAEVNGELVNLGVIKNFEGKDKLLPLPYADEGISYITIEPKGGNGSPTVKNIVANILYQ